MGEIDVTKHVKMGKSKKDNLIFTLEELLKKTCQSVTKQDDIILFRGLQYFFGAIMVSNSGKIALLEADDGYKIKANLKYGISWIGIILSIVCLFFGLFGIIIPAFIYFSSESRIRDKLEHLVTNAKEEME